MHGSKARGFGERDDGAHGDRVFATPIETVIREADSDIPMIRIMARPRAGLTAAQGGV
jgi:hypothetical protein